MDCIAPSVVCETVTPLPSTGTSATLCSKRTESPAAVAAVCS